MDNFFERAQKIELESLHEKDARRLLKEMFMLMHEKKSNLCLSIDFTNTGEILSLVEEVGDEICLLKTHIDIISDYSKEFVMKLEQIAKEKKFFIFEDRKFADIGNTVYHQYKGGLYEISKWSHFTNCHVIPGEGIIKGLKKAADETVCTLPRGLLLLAEMSSKGSLATDSYTNSCVDMANSNTDFVVGFIASKRVTDENDFIVMTPGVQLEQGTDNLGQQYRTPEMVIGQGSDIIIVGRGIYGSTDPVRMAKEYRKRAWDSYLKRIE